MNDELLTLLETEEIRKTCIGIKKEIVILTDFIDSDYYKSLNYVDKIPHNFKLGFLKTEFDKYAKKINYII